MPGWADDPELLATFRAEVEERVASLQGGLLQLETHPSPRQVVAGLFRGADVCDAGSQARGRAVTVNTAVCTIPWRWNCTHARYSAARGNST